MKTLTDLDDLLKDPAGTARRGLEGSVRAGTPARLLLGAGVLAAFYGASAGFFQGGAQIGVAALKAPLIVLGSLLLCAPSLYVFSALAGVRRPPRAFFLDLACFAGLLGLVLSALLPISWLFSVGSRSLLFMVWFHVIAWTIAVFFAHRFLSRALVGIESKGALVLWTCLLVVVSFQLATTLRPVLWRLDDGPLFESGKRFFTEQLEAVSKR